MICHIQFRISLYIMQKHQSFFNWIKELNCSFVYGFRQFTFVWFDCRMEVSKQNFEIPWLLNKNHHDNKIFLNNWIFLKFIIIYSKKATKFCKISNLLLTGITLDKKLVEISQNFVAFSEYMNFSTTHDLRISGENFRLESDR